MRDVNDPAEVYRALGVRPALNVSGTTSAYGGTKLRREAMEAMNSAATVLVDIHELNGRAGEIIAETVGAEAAFVSSGAAGGLVFQAAAVMAGNDPAKMAQLPDTVGVRNEIVIQNCQRFAYDQAYRAAGANLVGVGEGRRCHLWQLEAAYNERTAAVAYLFAPILFAEGAYSARGGGERPRQGHPRNRRRGLDAAAARQPEGGPAAGRRHGHPERWEGGARAPGHGHPGRQEGLGRGGGGQRQPQPVRRPWHEGRQGGDRRPRRGLADIRRGGRG